MTLNKLRNDIFDLATKQGFHGPGQDDLSRKLLLVVSECCEAMEAERNGKEPLGKETHKYLTNSLPTPEQFAEQLRGTIEEEIADAVIRLADIAGMLGMDLDWWVQAKMIYNRNREHKHGKKY